MSETGLLSARVRVRLGAVRKRVLLGLALLPTLVGVGLVLPAAADASNGLDVYVGYMDTHTVAASSKQPNPWPYTDSSRYIGTPCPDFGNTMACWDASALRLKNTTSSDITGVHVTVQIGSHTFDLWGSKLTVKAGGDLVLTETGSAANSENFDGSDFAPNDYNGGNTASCDNSGAYPTVTVTIGDKATTYTDTGQVLNGGGVDDGHCVNGTFVPGRIDESHPWTMIGTAPAGGGDGGGAGGGTSATGSGVCAGVRGCRLMVHADITGDGHRDAVAVARRHAAVLLRVQTGPDRVVQTRLPVSDWGGAAWAGVARLDGKRGDEILLGRRTAGAARFYQAVTWRRGRLVLLDAPGRARWWRVESSATVQAGWIHPHSSPAGTIRERVATKTRSGYEGRLRTYRWSTGGWRLVSSATLHSLPRSQALRWARFAVRGFTAS